MFLLVCFKDNIENIVQLFVVIDYSLSLKIQELWVKTSKKYEINCFFF